MTLIDISPPIRPGIQNWPGDTPYQARKLSTFDDGHLDLGTIETSVHVGAHTDAPMHYHPSGEDVASVPLDAYYGPCQVVEVRVSRGRRFGIDDVGGLEGITAPRVLFKTGTFPDPDQWNEDFAAPDPALLEALGNQGVRLVGFDTPSTDLMASKDLPAHRALLASGMMNLEGLVLDHVEPGHYTLLALPLRLEGMDASPVRAALAPAETPNTAPAMASA